VSSPGFYPNEFSLDLTGNIGFGKSKFVKVILMPQKDEEPVVEEPIVVKPPEKKAEKLEPTIFIDPGMEGSLVHENAKALLIKYLLKKGSTGSLLPDCHASTTQARRFN
jgi:hypothetical protein